MLTPLVLTSIFSTFTLQTSAQDSPEAESFDPEAGLEVELPNPEEVINTADEGVLEETVEGVVIDTDAPNQPQDESTESAPEETNETEAETALETGNAPIVYPPGSSCEDPLNWVEDETKRTEYSKTYYVPLEEAALTTNPEENPELFSYQSCVFAVQQSYTPPESEELIEIDNTIIPLEEVVTQTVNLEEVLSEKTKRRRNKTTRSSEIEYAYTNTANEFNVLFPRDPNDGYSFTNQDGDKVEIVEVAIGEEPLQTSPEQVELEENIIRYREILPGVDLEYVVTNSSVAKYVILKDETALENDLTSVRLTYSRQTQRLNKRNARAVERAARRAAIRERKVARAARQLERALRNKTSEEQEIIRRRFAIQAEIDALRDQERELRPNSGENKNKSEEEKELLSISREQVKEQRQAYSKLLRQLNRNKVTLEEADLEIERIENLASLEDEVTLEEEDISISTPVIYDANNEIRSESFEISDNGKEIVILPDTEYLNAEAREFPIRIDPETTTGSITKDTWVNSYNPSSNRNRGENIHHLAVGGNARLNVGSSGSADMGDTRSFLSFNLPGEVGPNQVINAQLRVTQYSNNGGNFRANIHNACDFDENGATWYNQPCIAGQFGHIDFDSYNCYSYRCTDNGQGERWSSNLAPLLNGNIGAGSYLMRLALLDSNEGAWRGVAFCARDGHKYEHPCNHGGKGPYLRIEYNRPSTTPNPVRPDFEDYIGACNLSLGTGNCNKDSRVNYRIENVHDGENGCNVRVQVVESSQFQGFYDADSFNGCGPDFAADHEQGDFTWTAKTIDNYGAESSTSDKRLKLTVDNSAPLLQEDSPLPEYSAGQINTTVPKYADNIQEKYVLEYAGAQYYEQNAYLKHKDRYWGVAGSVTTGASVVLKESLGEDYTEWRLRGDNTLRPSTNQNLCLTIDRTGENIRTVGSSVSLQDCSPSRGKRWTHTGYNQYKSHLADEAGNQASLCLSAWQTELSVDTCDRRNGDQEIILENNETLRRALDIGAGSNGSFSDAHLWSLSTTNSNQTFTLEQTNTPDEFRIMTRDQRCLNTGDWIYNTNAYNCSGNQYQTWRYDRETMELKVKAGNFTHCLNVPYANTDNGSEIQSAPCNQSWSQKWRFVKVEENPPEYSHLIMAGNGFAIDGDQATAGRNVHMWNRHSGDNQQWTYRPESQQFELLAGDNLCLNKNGSNLDLAPCSSTANQRFEIIDGGRIRHVSSRLCLDATNYNQGANVYLYPCHGGANQSFSWEGSLDDLLQGQQLLYNVQVSDEPNFLSDRRVDLGWQRSPYIQYPGQIVSNFNRTVTLRHRPSGKIMEHGCLSNDCRPYVWQANQSPPQQMIVTDEERVDFTNTTTFRLRPNTYSNLCLELIGDSDPTFKLCGEGNQAQQWQIHDLYLSDQGGQFEGIHSVSQPNRCLDIPYSNAYNGATVRMGNCSSHPAQDFELITREILNTEPLLLENGEEYYVRVRARDRTFGIANTSGWAAYKTTIDAQAPRLIETNFTNNVLKPNQNGSEALFEIVLDETHLDRVEGEVYARGDAPERVYTITSCRRGTESVPCTNQGSVLDDNGHHRLTMSWNGRDENNNPLPDGVYEILLRAYDKAGQVSDLPVGDNFVTLDSRAQGVNVSWPKNQGYVNDSQGSITGGVYSFAGENNNLDSLRVYRYGSGWRTLSIDSATSTFTVTPETFDVENLFEPGLNRFWFYSRDSVGNYAYTSYQVTLETDLPNIVSLDTAEFVNSAEVEASFALDDVTSGFYLGTNPAGYDISLVQEQDGDDWQEIPLFNNGQPASKPTARLTSDLNCSQTTAGATCDWSMLNFQTAGTYHLLVRVRDQAGNEVCNHDFSELDQSLTCETYADIEQSFVVRTDLASELHTPANQTTLAGEVLVDGIVEKGADLAITSTALGRELRHRIESTEAILPAEHESNTGDLVAATDTNSTSRTLTHDGTRLGIECPGQTRDHDSNPNTPEEEICSWEVYVNLAGTGSNTVTENDFVVTSGKEGVVDVASFTATYDATALNLSSTSALSSFSPNNDDFLETIEFENSATTAIYVTPQTEANNSNTHTTEFTTAAQINPTATAGQYQLYFDLTNQNTTLDNVDLELTVLDEQETILQTLTTEQVTIPQGETGYFAYTFANLPANDYRLALHLRDTTGASLYTEATVLEFTVENIQNANTLETVRADYRATVKNTSGQLVWQSPAPTTLNSNFGEELRDLPATLEYNGLVNVESTPENNHGLDLSSTLPDGDYTYELAIKQSPEGVTYPTAPLAFSVVTTLPAGSLPVIQTPRDGLVTTKGIVQVSGQASASIAQREYTVEICLDNANDTAECTYRAASPVSQSGNFNVLVSLPEITEPTNLTLRARTRDQSGNVTVYTEPRSVIVDPSEITLDVQTVQDHTGRNSLEEIDEFFQGNLALEELRVVTFEIEVDQYTEAVDLDIVGNVTADSSSTNRQRLATITGLPEENENLNPQANPNVKADRRSELSQGNGYEAGKELGDGERCENPEGCTWIYRYVLGERDELNAGSYAVEVTAYKGESVATTSTSFAVNGVVPYAPRILSADKLSFKPNCSEGATTNGYEDCRELTRAIQLHDYSTDTETIYTNTSELTLRGASDPLSQVTLTATKDNQEITVDAQADERGVFNLPVLELTDSGDYTVTLNAANESLSTDNAHNIVIRYDTTAPVVTSVRTDTVSEYTPFATNPWIKSGDPVRITFATDEPTHRGAVFNEQGFICGTVKTNFTQEVIEDNCVENGDVDLSNEEGLKNIEDPRTGEVIDCSQHTARELYTQAQGVPYICHWTYLTRGEQTGVLTVNGNSGVFYPTLFAEDLAGNKTFFGNNPQLLTSTRSYLGNLNTKSNYLYETDSSEPHENNVVLEVDNLRNQLIAGNTSGLSVQEQAILNGDANTDPLPAGYPYAQTERGRSLDMTLFLDNELTRKPEVILEGWGDLRDGVCAEEADLDLPEVDRQLGTNYLNDLDNANVPRTCPEVTVNSVNNDRQPVYVVKGNTFEVQAEVERNQRVILAYQLKAGEQEVGNTVYKALSGVEESGSCTSGTNNEVRTSDNQLVQRFTDTCTVTYSFEFPEGSGQAVGNDGSAPSDNYVFRLYAVDLAGNLSVEVEDNSTGFRYDAESGETTALNNDASFVQSTSTQSLQIYHDAREPVTPSLNLSNENVNLGISGNQGVEGVGDALNRAVTKDTQVVGSHSGEDRSDIDYTWQRVADANGASLSNQTVNERLLVNGFGKDNERNIQNDNWDDNSGETVLDLGTISDGRDGCVVVSNSPVVNRQIGTCEDGVYRVDVESTDTAGNTSESVSKIVERDTVKPAIDLTNFTLLPDEDNLRIDLDMNGLEAGAFVSITNGNPQSPTSVNGRVSADGTGRLNILWPEYYTYSTDYAWDITLVDRAGNVSESVTVTYRTKDAPVFSAVCVDGSGQKINLPFTDTYPITSPFGNRISPITGITEFHNGTDYGLPNNTPIIAPADGIVQTVAWDNLGGGNMLVIWHPQLGIRTGYLHLSKILVRQGTSVSVGQEIARSGNTGGQSTGPHLHFSVLAGEYGLWNDTAVNPDTELVECNTYEEEFTEDTILPIGFRGDPQDPWNGKTAMDIRYPSFKAKINRKGEVIDRGRIYPSPYITYIEEDFDSGDVSLYGLAHPGDREMRVELKHPDNRWCFFLGCTATENVDTSIDHSRLIVYKYTTDGKIVEVDGLWVGNKQEQNYGRWELTIDASMVEDAVLFLARQEIYGSFKFNDKQVNYNNTRTNYSNFAYLYINNIQQKIWDEFKVQTFQNGDVWTNRELINILIALRRTPDKMIQRGELIIVKEKSLPENTCYGGILGYVLFAAPDVLVMCDNIIITEDQDISLEYQGIFLHELFHTYQANKEYNSTVYAEEEEHRDLVDKLYDYDTRRKAFIPKSSIIPSEKFKDICGEYNSPLDPNVNLEKDVFVSRYDCASSYRADDNGTYSKPLESTAEWFRIHMMDKFENRNSLDKSHLHHQDNYNGQNLGRYDWMNEHIHN